MNALVRSGRCSPLLPLSRAQTVAPTPVPLTKFVPADRFTVPAGFELTVWAQAPQLRNPTNMDVDAQGRIWVTEAVNYRAHAGRDKAGDRIVVLEDTDSDGVADSSHVFVQELGLVAPLGIAVIDNQIIVSCAPDLIVYISWIAREKLFASAAPTIPTVRFRPIFSAGNLLNEPARPVTTATFMWAAIPCGCALMRLTWRFSVSAIATVTSRP